MRRRDVFGLAGASALAGALPRAAADDDPNALLPGLPAAFSTAERDFRWQKVRSAMRKAGFDVLLTPASGGEGDADSRYLTQHAGWVVFPLEGPVVAVADAGDRGRGAAGTGWASETKRADDGRWSPGIVEAMRALKLERAKVGVGRLHGVPRNLEGDVSATTLQRVRDAFPRASFDSAADLLVRVKLVRSAEELRVLEQATMAGERALDVLFRAARPGRRHLEVWTEVFAALTGATGEPPARLALRGGDEANTSGGRPLPERLQAGQVLNQEIAGQVLGHMAQVNHSFVVGGPPPADWSSAARYCADVLDELVAALEPGRPFLEVCRLYARRAQARSPELEPRWVLLHTCGLGDGPRLGLLRDEARDLVIEPGMAFTVKPRILVKGAKPTAQYGDPVVVTATGARRLGKRRLGPDAA